MASSRVPETRRIRALLVDDGIRDRRLLAEILAGGGAFDVVTAPTASIGLQRLAQLTPELVLLDAMLDSVAATGLVREIRASWPWLPIVMLCDSSDRAAALEAVKCGANGWVTKPTTTDVVEEHARFCSEVLAKMRAGGPPRTISSAALRIPSSAAVPIPGAFVTAIAVGASTGGPNALGRVFEKLPRDLPVPIFVVQHMPPVFTRMLADRLRSSSGFDVVEATHGEVVIPSRAYVAPGNFHMSVVRDAIDTEKVTIALDQSAHEGSCRPAIDVLFRSVARTYGAGALAAVLTGMGHDGTQGAMHVVDAGGSVIVQDAASAVVATMPQSVATATVASVFPLEELAEEIAKRVRRRRRDSRGGL